MGDAGDRADDRLLVKSFLEGRRQSFDLLVERYYKVLFNVAFRMVGNRDEAQDIAQTTFMKAYEKINTYNPKFKFFSWIYRILINESLNYTKRQRPISSLAGEILVTRTTPATEYEQRRLSQDIQEAMMELSVQQRQVIALRHFGELSYQEISDVLSIPEKTVKSRLFSARRRLSAILMGKRTAT